MERLTPEQSGILAKIAAQENNYREGWERVAKIAGHDPSARPHDEFHNAVTIFGLCHAIEQHIARQTQEIKELREALEKIRRTPTMPFPDAGAHSERTFGQAVWRAWSAIQGIAASALSRTSKPEPHE